MKNVNTDEFIMIVVISEHCQGRACGCIKKMVQLQLDWIVSRCVGGLLSYGTTFRLTMSILLCKTDTRFMPWERFALLLEAASPS